jgi:hypothetical protein
LKNSPRIVLLFILILAAALRAYGLGGPLPPTLVAQAQPLPPRSYSDLLLSDLIVRGHVTSITKQMVLAHDFDSTWQESDGYFYILSVDMNVDEVLKGNWDSRHLNYSINISSSGLYGDYSTDKEILVGLVYLPNARDGSYTLQMSDSRFVRVDDMWALEGSKTARVSLEDIRAVIAPTMTPAIAKSASSIVVGSVSKYDRADLYDPNDSTRVSSILMLTVEVTDTLKGHVSLGQHEIRCFGGGNYLPAWAGHGPLQIDIGPEYCMFLTEADGQLTIIGGANGLYQIGNDGRLKHNRLETSLTIPTLRKMMLQE